MPIKNFQFSIFNFQLKLKKTFPLPRRQTGFPLSPFPCTGYTLIELLIVIAIIAILSMTSFVYFNNFGVSQGVDRNVLIIQNAIEIAQTNASTGLKCPGSIDSTGWIVEFSGAASPPIINLICKSADTEVPVKTYSIDTKATLDSITSTDTTNCPLNSFRDNSTKIALLYGSVSGQNKFIFDRGVVGRECSGAKSINIKVNYNESTAPKTFGLNLSGAIN